MILLSDAINRKLIHAHIINVNISSQKARFRHTNSMMYFYAQKQVVNRRLFVRRGAIIDDI